LLLLLLWLFVVFICVVFMSSTCLSSLCGRHWVLQQQNTLQCDS